MTKIKKRFGSVVLGLLMALGVGVSIGVSNTRGEIAEVMAAETTYTHVMTTKPTAGSDNKLSEVTWNVSATNLNSFNRGYAGVQFGTSKLAGAITFTSKYAWGEEESATNYYGSTKIKSVKIWLNQGGGTTSATVTIGGVSATSDGTTVAKKSSVSDYTGCTGITYTPAEGGDKGVIVIAATSTKAGYFCAVQVISEEPSLGALTGITLSDQTTEYYTDHEFKFSGKCTAIFEGGSKAVTPTSVSTPDMSTVGEKTVEVSYTDPNDETNIKTASYTINVIQSPYEGNGTQANPYTVSDAYLIASGLDSGKNNGKLVYVEGVVSGDVSVTNSRGTFDITDGKQTIKAFSITGVEKSDSTNANYVADQYRVVIGGAVINYSGTYEIGYASGFSSSLYSSKAPATLTINMPETLDLNASGTFTATTDAADPTIVWSSSNDDLVYVDSNGDYIVSENITGTVTINASLTYEDCILPIAASAEVVVVDPNAHGIVITGDKTVSVGKTIQLTATCIKGDTITWSSNLDTIASVSSEGLVTGLAEGDVIITATCANGATATYDIQVTPKLVLFSKATSNDDLVVGKEVVIADENANNVMSTTQNENNRKSISATKDGNYIVKTDDTAVFTLLPAKNGGYAFYDKTANAMLSSVSSSKNYLHTDGNYGDENAYATITFTDSKVGVQFQGENTRNLLKKNSTSDLFSCYSSDQTGVSIYVAVDGEPEILGDAWAKAFNEGANCDPTGVRVLEESTWTELKTAFESQSIPEKMAASYLDADSALATEDFKKAISSYEYCLIKYGYVSFINGKDATSSSLSNKLYREKNEGDATLTIAIVSIMSVTSVGGLFLIRKRRRAGR